MKTVPVWRVVVKDRGTVCGRLKVAIENRDLAKTIGREWALQMYGQGGTRCDVEVNRLMHGGLQLEVFIP